MNVEELTGIIQQDQLLINSSPDKDSRKEYYKRFFKDVLLKLELLDIYFNDSFIERIFYIKENLCLRIEINNEFYLSYNFIKL